MRKKDKIITDNQQLKQIIRSSLVCRLGLTDGKKPYIVPLNFGFSCDQTDEQAVTSLYFHSAAKGKKIELLKANQNVCFEFEQGVKIAPSEKPCNWNINYQTVIGYGKAVFIEDFEEKRQALNAIMDQYSGKEYFPGNEYPFKDGAIKKTTVFKVVIEEMTGKQENDID